MMGDLHYCSFCGASSEEVDKIIVTHGEVKICNNCVTGCVKILGETKSNESLEQQNKTQKEMIGELVKSLDEAADAIIEYANHYNNDSTVVVTEAHEEADKYRALITKAKQL